MNCDAIQDLLPEFALGSLAPSQALLVTAHLHAGCAQCAGQLAETQAALSLLPLSLDPVAPTSKLRQRLEARLTSDQQNPASPPARLRLRPRRPSYFPAALLGAAIAALLFLAFGVPSYLTLQQNLARTREQLFASESQVTDLQQTLATEEETLRAVRSPTNAVISLTTKGASPAAGRIFLDPGKGKWWLSATGLQPLPPDKTYEFWLIPAGKNPVPSGTFKVDASGSGYLTGPIPAAAGTIAKAAITDEPSPGTGSPTGAIRLSASLQP